MTQTLIIHVIRTKKIPFIQGRASWPLTVTTAIVMSVGMWLPSSPLAAALGFTPLPPLYWPLLFLTLLCYVVLTQIVKMWLIRRHGCKRSDGNFIRSAIRDDSISNYAAWSAAKSRAMALARVGSLKGSLLPSTKRISLKFF
jgi:hypothetical protein